MSSYWLEEEAPPLQRRGGDARPDVAIVGAGVTGCSCALTLAREGVLVRVYEAREVASGASGRNGGFALRGLAAAYEVARVELGAEKAAALWRLTERALDRMETLAGDALRRTGSLRLASNDDEAHQLRAEYDALVAGKFAAEWLTELEPPLGELYTCALVHPRDGVLQPARWVRRLAAHAAEAGAEIREHEPVGSLGDLDADQVVIATDGYTHGLLAPLDAAVRPTRGQVIATEPLPQLVFPRPHYSYDGFRYWHQTQEGRLVLGGFRDLSIANEWTRDEVTTDAIQSALDGFARELIGGEPKVSHRWSGIFGTTADYLPIVGRVPGLEAVWASVGYSGHGNVLGFACGDGVAQAILGRPLPELDVFDPARLLERSPDS